VSAASPHAITHVVENLNRGGLERVVIDLVRMQLRQGHRVQVICLFERGSLANELEASGVPVFACGKRRGPDLRALLRLRRRLRALGTDVMHTHNATAHYHAVLAVLGLKLRIVNTRHGMGALDLASRREKLFRRTLSRTDAIVTVCEAARRELLAGGALPADLLVAIPNGIAVDRFALADAATRATLVAALGLPAHTRIIGTVGRLNWAKNHAELVRAFGDVLRAAPDTALVIVGDGELRGELDALAADAASGGRVFALGDRSDVADLLRGFDVFAMSSVTEGYSVALLEACATGLPIAATDVGGNAEIVRDGLNGRIVAKPARAELAAALRDLLSDPARAAAMGRAGREWVVGQGSLEAMAARYESLYALGARRRSTAEIARVL
jgi:glycosyltransferase involved in cell wall biosynthesis